MSVNLAGGSQVRLTENRLQGVVFGAAEPLQDGRLVYSRQHRNEDLWLLRRRGAGGSTPTE